MTEDELKQKGAAAEKSVPDGRALKPLRAAENYSLRMRKAGYVVGKQYDALKNAFLGYYKPKGNKRVKSRITASGETFSAGRRAVAKLAVVGGYLRLFLALDPKAYNQDKYHHKDYSEVARYQNYPFMLRIRSERSLKYALELIAETLKANGYTKNEEYVWEEQAQIFCTTQLNRMANAGGNGSALSDGALPDEKTLKSLRAAENYSVRMRKAGYLAGKQYDAVKNAFLSYRTPKGKAPKSRIAAGGETFSAGRITIGKIVVVGGYLRLFLALDPKAYNKEKYHFKDYSEVARYAKYPLMIRIASGRSLKYALELIAETMKFLGLEENAAYVPQPQAQIFYTQQVAWKKKRGAANAAEAAQDGEENESAEELAEEAAEEEELLELAAAEETEAAEAELLFAEEVSAQEAEKEEAEEEEETPVVFFPPRGTKGARLPVRAAVFSGKGEKIGKVRRGVWRDLSGGEQGSFAKRNEEVWLYREDAAAGYVDRNDNIFTASDEYVATLRYPRWWLLLLLLVFIAVAVLSFLLAVSYLSRSEGTGNGIPTLFVADADGTEWDEEANLQVFFNDTFGDTKIAPGQDGSYAFQFANTNTEALIFSLTFTEENPYEIGLVYRLKRDGAYIAGADGYTTADGISCGGLTIEASSVSVFYIEWYWRDNDAVDTRAGENSALYTLNIGLSASFAER